MSHAVYGHEDELVIFSLDQGPETTSRYDRQQADPLHLTGPDLEGGEFTGLQHAGAGYLACSNPMQVGDHWRCRRGRIKADTEGLDKAPAATLS
jgi:hypothetical protein